MANSHFNLPKVESRPSTYRSIVSARQKSIRNESNPTNTNDVLTLPQIPVIPKTKPNESIRDYIKKKRELLLTQYNLAEKAEELQHFAAAIDKEDEQLRQAEKNLESETKMFENFLSENKRLSMEARKKAEVAITLKMERTQEMKQMQTQINGIKTEISKLEESLKESQNYQKFLMEITSQPNDKDDNTASTKVSGQCFPSPHKLLAVYDELRDKNLRLMEILVHEEQTAEDVQIYKKWITDRISKSVKQLEDEQRYWVTKLGETMKQVNDLKDEKKKIQKYLQSKRYQAAGDRLTRISAKINEVYESCLRPNDAKLPETDLLNELESLLENLVETVDYLPADQVHFLQKLRFQQRQDMQRRSRLYFHRPEGECARCQRKAKNADIHHT